MVVAPPPPPIVEEAPVEAEITKIEAPELEGPKVIDKIDLSAIDSSTRPKKGKKSAPKEVEAPEETVEQSAVTQADTVLPAAPAAQEQEEEPAPVIGQTAGEEPQPEEDETPPVIENIKAEKLEGPKILGKIDLPANSDTRPKQPSEEKRETEAHTYRKARSRRRPAAARPA